ncbi:MAG: MinD/ParA family protein [Acetobacteraceae bacterium]|nr:MinD/ParA family protein [Acetobacteraceae bacterium]
MGKVVAIHSFRGGTGKSNISANLGFCLARRGLKVAIIDSDIVSPGIHAIFGFEPDAPRHTLNSFLAGNATIKEIAHPIDMPEVAAAGGALYLIPSSLELSEISHILRNGYNVSLLIKAFKDLVSQLTLDFLLIDTHPGINEETLLAIAVADCLIVVLRLDKQDYQGTGITLEVSRKLGTRRLLLVNNVTADHDPREVTTSVEDAFGASVIGVLPHAPALMALGSSACICQKEPDQPFAAAIDGVAGRLIDVEGGALQ